MNSQSFFQCWEPGERSCTHVPTSQQPHRKKTLCFCFRCCDQCLKIFAVCRYCQRVGWTSFLNHFPMCRMCVPCCCWLVLGLLHEFMDSVQSARSRLMALCTSVEDYVEKTMFLSDLNAREKAMDAACAEVGACMLEQHAHSLSTPT